MFLNFVIKTKYKYLLSVIFVDSTNHTKSLKYPMYREKNALVLDDDKDSLNTESSEQVSNQLSLFYCLNSNEILINICAQLSGKSGIQNCCRANSSNKNEPDLIFC